MGLVRLQAWGSQGLVEGADGASGLVPKEVGGSTPKVYIGKVGVGDTETFAGVQFKLVEPLFNTFSICHRTRLNHPSRCKSGVAEGKTAENPRSSLCFILYHMAEGMSSWLGVNGSRCGEWGRSGEGVLSLSVALNRAVSMRGCLSRETSFEVGFGSA